MTEFTFPATAEASAYCEGILDEMQRIFGLDRLAALTIMNEEWNGKPLLTEVEAAAAGSARFGVTEFTRV